ncbi:blue copper-like protein [Cinnamomum micranthum f. kanehirae]|uniref:Blue copper-like protein n=1 Tax=Cinnamomum micranthum f. kanehirae TaxID=337451 RepID=A0A443N1N2_9MAGN|nr:blue copper-like protein [Cinnamomum micranthum f. kanehirae]
MGSWMGLIGSIIVVIAALAQCTAAETTFNVGDAAGWTLPFSSSWATGKTFVLGDKLNFTFDAQAHDVAEVSKAYHDSCVGTSTISLFTTSPTVIPLNTTGEHYYICTKSGHCASGQKLSINVVSSTTESPASSPPPTAGSTPPSPSSAPSRAAAFGVAGAFMAVLTALFL